MYPKCNSNKCKWNMGNKHRKGYDYLDNTCYLDNCDKKSKKESEKQ